ncbi:MAG TPA: palindromic element RPE4 domain-containing protein [Rickettsia endosymbiont of Ceroptres masudai]|nr:palindromic element RPE4 domain-containing protein [Rickettsia endosymbiont of Ceroptres masudai]
MTTGSSKTYKNLFLYVYFVKHAVFVIMLRLFFLDPVVKPRDDSRKTVKVHE